MHEHLEVMPNASTGDSHWFLWAAILTIAAVQVILAMRVEDTEMRLQLLRDRFTPPTKGVDIPFASAPEDSTDD